MKLLKPKKIPQKVGLDVAGGRVGELDIFSLSHRIFKGASFWHGRWKLKRALKEVA